MPWCCLFGGMLFVRTMSSGRPSPLNDDPGAACGGMLVESQFLDESQMQRIPAGDGTEAGHARSLTEVNEQCPNCLNSGVSSRGQAPVGSEFLPEICDPVPDAKGGILFKEANSVQESR